jgi:outer membrane protein OmpA-like peptidoglycan-associated protein
VRKEQDYGEVALDDELSLTLQTYDSETQAILNKEKRVLPLGQIHRLGLSHAGYHDTTLVVNTQRPTVFTETELDIAMRAKKSRHRFIVVDKMTGSALMDANVRMDGRPTAKDTLLRLNEEHSLQVSAKGYVFDDTLFTTGNTTSQHVVVMRLVPLTKDLVLQLRNIQFEHDSYELTESSNEELEALAQLLFMNPTLRIELSSHTDDQGSDKYNDRLSTMRGKAVEKWLLDRGVDGERMVIVGYGKRKPLVANDSDENRAINRRVEIKVLDF